MKKCPKWEVNPEKSFQTKKVRIEVEIMFHTKQFILKVIKQNQL